MSTSDEGAGPGPSPIGAAWYEGVSGWQPLSRVFIDRELGKPEPDFRSFADRLAPYSAAERHAGWIGVAQSAPSRMGRTRAYVEALHNDPDPTSVAWSWLDGDFDLMERVEHVLSPDDEHTPAMVETVRNRIGSIVDFGGSDMTIEQAGGEPATGPETEQPAVDEAVAVTIPDADAAQEVPAAEEMAAAPEVAAAEEIDAAPEVAAAEEIAWAQDATAPQDAAATEDEAAQDATAPQDVAVAEDVAKAEDVATAEPVVEQAVAAAPVVQSQAPAPWSPTHLVPAGGVAAWDYPDPARPPRVILSEGLALVVDGVAGEWALVRAVNGWQGWVDGRRLITRP